MDIVYTFESKIYISYVSTKANIKNFSNRKQGKPEVIICVTSSTVILFYLCAYTWVFQYLSRLFKVHDLTGLINILCPVIYSKYNLNGNRLAKGLPVSMWCLKSYVIR